VKKAERHKYVYGGYEVGSGGPIWCKVCGKDVEDPIHIPEAA
jgi:hypothetical protein